MDNERGIFSVWWCERASVVLNISSQSIAVVVTKIEEFSQSVVNPQRVFSSSNLSTGSAVFLSTAESPVQPNSNDRSQSQFGMLRICNPAPANDSRNGGTKRIDPMRSEFR